MSFRAPPSPLFCHALALWLLAGLSAPSQAKPHDYRFDPVHTRIVFLIDHAGLSRALGSFSGITGQLRFDPDDLASATVSASVPLASLDFGDAGWRKAVLASKFLDAEKFPAARFVSTRVEPGSDGNFKLFGQLSLRGVSREVVLDAKLNAVKRHPLSLRRSAGFSATAVLQRADFGMTAWASVIGQEVSLLIEVEAQRNRTQPDTSEEAVDATTQ